MIIRDETVLLPPPPPAPPAAPDRMPYSIQPRVHGYGVFALERPTKVRPDGYAGELPTDDELAVYAVVEHLEGQLRGDVSLDADPPEVPYIVRPLKVGIHGEVRIEKLSPRGYSQGWLSGDEVAAWRWLEVLREQVAEKRASAPPVAPVEPATDPAVVALPPEEPASARPKRAASQGR